MAPREAELVLDNADTGVPGGVRSLDGDGRQLVFRHGGLQVELMLQTSRPGPVVWGKLHEAADGRPCEGARATLLDLAEEECTHTNTDAWGEFCLTAAGGLGAVLRVEYRGDSFVCWLGAGGSRAAAAREVATTR